ncbi:dipeptidyl-peptidase 4 [Thermotomaculum hydrothermale]|uniref:Dipeptidyl-peptidase 4 n=1 Tax=Thermotomaculum hydrothermale TaxID=981385 RepID=A0A7R6PN34_9BACT|nr:S9 family peptidase [Thermotomaculum hydrothermale]BBB32121.1 dipeptidyl-peptidase 4 [Thermotomaculum hydrothermale]
MKKKSLFLIIFTILSVNLYADKLLDNVISHLKGSKPRMMAFKWSPSSNYIGFLSDKDNNFILDLWIYDLKTGKERELINASKFKIKESEAEKQLKERMRIGNSGIIFFHWFHNGDRILFNLSGNIYTVEVKSGKIEKLPINVKPVLFPIISNNDTKIAFVSKGNVYVYLLNSKKTIQITKDASKDKYYGMAEFAASEELDRFSGLWFSPDGKKLLYTFVDETKMDKYPIVINTSLKPKYTLQNYPFAGGKNAVVKLFIADFNGEKFESKEIKFPLKKEYYLARVYFYGNNPFIYIINRKQNILYKYLYKKDELSLLSKETSKDWINLDSNYYYWKEKNAILFTSEKTPSAYRHLFIFKNNRIEQLTKGEWEIKSFKGFDGEKLYFTANITHPNNVDFAVYNFKTKGIKVLTKKKGYHIISMSPDCKYYIDTYSNRSTPFEKYLVNLKTGEKKLFEKTGIEKIEGLKPCKVEEVSFKNKEGIRFFGVLMYPENIKKGGKIPLIVYTYGGPHAQVCTNFFNPWDYYWFRYFTTKGYAVFKMDNRGSAGRGHKFESPIYRDMGDLEIKDQIEGVKYIVNKFPFIDINRVGIWGWSYGGYMTLTAMTKFAPFFKVGVAVAPVSDWHLYDTAYTERYMDLPQNNKEGYEKSSPLNYVEKLQGKLLILHGVSDDNVHFQNTELFLKKAIENGKKVDLMVFPGKKHSIRGRKTREYLFKRITEYFLNNL